MTETPATEFTWTRRHVTALTLLREDGRGQAVNLVELRAAGA
jgi:hypothetical protein